jgi:hypothetical protein
VSSRPSIPSYGTSVVDPVSVAAPRLQLLDEALKSRGIRAFYTTWLRWIRTKGLPAKKIGGRYYVDLSELDGWIAARGVAAVTTPAGSFEPTAGPAARAMHQSAAKEVLAARRGGGTTRGRGRRMTSAGGGA